MSFIMLSSSRCFVSTSSGTPIAFGCCRTVWWNSSPSAFQLKMEPSRRFTYHVKTPPFNDCRLTISRFSDVGDYCRVQGQYHEILEHVVWWERISYISSSVSWGIRRKWVWESGRHLRHSSKQSRYAPQGPRVEKTVEMPSDCMPTQGRGLSLLCPGHSPLMLDIIPS